MISMARKQIQSAKISSLGPQNCKTRLVPLFRNQNHLRVNKFNDTPGTYTFGKGVIRNPKFDSPTEETGSALVRKT
ncbi:unnamed protein product, partial [Hymenolepis diminuta]